MGKRLIEKGLIEFLLSVVICFSLAAILAGLIWALWHMFLMGGVAAGLSIMVGGALVLLIVVLIINLFESWPPGAAPWD